VLKPSTVSWTGASAICSSGAELMRFDFRTDSLGRCATCGRPPSSAPTELGVVSGLTTLDSGTGRIECRPAFAGSADTLRRRPWRPGASSSSKGSSSSPPSM